MENWQFLIQKQGDRSWQTLESPNLQISEGFYRILARSHLPNIDVEVRVTHSSTQKVPKRQISKRSRRTNAEGLMAVIPFTHLNTGLWELRLSGDLMADMLGQSWQHKLLIQVSPSQLIQQSEILEAEEQDTNTLSEEDAINQPISPVWFNGETVEQILQNLMEIAIPNTESLLEVEKVGNIPPISAKLPFKLTLDQDTYIALWGKALTINGYVELQEAESSSIDLDSLQLVVELRSPWESQILWQIQQPIPNKQLPFIFSTSIDIPANCESKLILADINLHGTLTDVSQKILLGSHSFTITADVSQLLAITKAQPTNPNSLAENNEPKTQEQPTKSESSLNLGLELFNLVKTPKLAHFSLLKPSPTQTLPPLINPNLLSTTEANSLKLPKLPESQKKTDDPIPEAASVIPPINLRKLVIKPKQKTFPFLKPLAPLPDNKEAPKTRELHIWKFVNSRASQHLLASSTAEITGEILPSYIPDEDELAREELDNIDDQITISPREELDNIDDQIRTSPREELPTITSLNTYPLLRKWMESQGHILPEPLQIESLDDEIDQSIQEQLLDIDLNLNQLTQEQLLGIDLNQSLNVDEEIEIPVENISPEIIIPTPTPWLSPEIVIDDLDSELGIEEDYKFLTDVTQAALELSSVNKEAVPTPQLYLPDGELVAGQSVRVRVELPYTSLPLGVKLWVEDYQTRRLLDGPHLLQHLLPNALGGQEGMTQLNIPFGCLEIRIEAIALNLHTQEESHKVKVIKTVVPPDLPNVHPDQFFGL
ncbi:hypothetical protein VB711_20530 [Cronbergia sp. UHCC 0137]|uniref:hypothetical protein n=1 Tax=Cronbergia sp. UHCC 0137 TaxID=3110239 RepID=UPI002B1FF093|nr:hypothetical protein [Cronbergia sp. UHCC 0137]MEA5620213.1 hypothetical protein [Cronbergia sp. UHCC 0137]